MRALGVALALALSACGSADPRPAVILDPGGWVLASPASDPFEDRPADPRCAADGFGEEAEVFEVETDRCAYLTVTQALPEAMPEGARFEGLVWHLGLFAETATRAHVALWVGQTPVVELRPAVPGPEAFYSVDWRAPAALPARTPIYFHVHNHGFNSYRLGPLTISPNPPPEG